MVVKNHSLPETASDEEDNEDVSSSDALPPALPVELNRIGDEEILRRPAYLRLTTSTFNISVAVEFIIVRAYFNNILLFIFINYCDLTM